MAQIRFQTVAVDRLPYVIDLTSSRVVARCEACAQLLPEPDRRRPGGKQLYCPDGQGGYEGRIGVTCREAGPHLKYVREHFSPTVLAAADLAALGEHVAAAKAVLAPDGPLGALTRVLTALDDRLGNTVADALARAEQAEHAAREATGQAAAEAKLRQIADQHNAKSVYEQHKAERARDAAVDRQHRAEAAQRAAETAQARAEGERDTLGKRAERAGQDAETAREQLRQVETHNVALTTQVGALTDQLHQATSQAERERAAAELARQEVTAALTDADTKIRQARDTADAAITAARTDLINLGDRHATTLQQLERNHAQVLRERDHQLRTAQTTLAAATVTINRLLRTLRLPDKT
jgi:hypothetical protein